MPATDPRAQTLPGPYNAKSPPLPPAMGPQANPFSSQGRGPLCLQPFLLGGKALRCDFPSLSAAFACRSGCSLGRPNLARSPARRGGLSGVSLSFGEPKARVEIRGAKPGSGRWVRCGLGMAGALLGTWEAGRCRDPCVRIRSLVLQSQLGSGDCQYLCGCSGAGRKAYPLTCQGLTGLGCQGSSQLKGCWACSGHSSPGPWTWGWGGRHTRCVPEHSLQQSLE